MNKHDQEQFEALQVEVIELASWVKTMLVTLEALIRVAGPEQVNAEVDLINKQMRVDSLSIALSGDSQDEGQA